MQPNVCIVVLDAVRAQNLSRYGHTRETTPNIDALATDGVVFSSAVSPAPVTLDSTASLFTGLYPGEHGAGENGRIVTAVPQLPELLADAGYATGAVTTNPFITPGFGFERGVDEFVSLEHRFPKGVNMRQFFNEHKELPSSRMYFEFLKRSLDRHFVSHVGNALQFKFDLFSRADNGANETTKNTTAFVREHDDPWFLYAHYSETHMKNVEHWYAVPEADKYRYVDRDVVEATPIARNPEGAYDDEQRDVHERLYDGALRYLDRHVGDVVDELKANGVYDDTLLVVTADHGECLGEHGVVGHGQLYEEGVHVPLVVKPPAGAGVSLDDRGDRVNTLGLYATITDLVDGVSTPAHASVPSVFESDSPVLVQDYSDSWSWSSYETELDGKHALYEDALKLWKRGPDVDLYDLDADPGETSNVFEDHDRGEELHDALEEILEGFGDRDPAREDIDLDGRTSAQLEDLGYL
jgi:arylsulfatase A-like enzyme